MEIGLAWGQRQAPAGRTRAPWRPSAGWGQPSLAGSGSVWLGLPGRRRVGQCCPLRGALAAAEGWAFPGVLAYRASMALL